ncbi:MAG: CHRD domain-containing protein [Acidimicrobiales bacterium]
MRKHLVPIVIGLLALTVAWGATGGPASAAANGRSDIAVGIVRLDGRQENPDADPDGRGTLAYAAFDSRFCYLLTARNIEPSTAAHIHVGAPEVNGPIVIALIAPTGGFSADCIKAVPDGSLENGPEVLLQSELDAIIATESDFYVNVHNATFPGGAIRAQLR